MVPGELSLTDDGGKLTYLQSGDGVLEFTGYYDDVREALASGLVFTPTQDFYGAVTLKVIVDDQGHVSMESQAAGAQGTVDGALTASGDLSITVQGVNDRPTLKVPADQSTYWNTPLPLDGFLVDDVDMPYVPPGGGRDLLVTVTVPAGSGTLELADTEGLTGDTDGSDGNLSFTGELDAINHALNGMTYSASNCFFGLVELSIDINDQGNYGLGVPLDVSDTVRIMVKNSQPKPPAPYPEPLGDGSFWFDIEEASRAQLPWLLGEKPLPEGSYWNHLDEASSDSGQSHHSSHGALPTVKSEGWPGQETKHHIRAMERWLNLEEFLEWCDCGDRRWFTGKPLNDVILVFNVDEINLLERLNSLMTTASDALFDYRSIADFDSGEPSHKPLAGTSMVFDMVDLHVSDLLFQDGCSPQPFCSGQDLSKSNDFVCKVFDLNSVSFAEVLSS